jgi:hypothetical protein
MNCSSGISTAVTDQTMKAFEGPLIASSFFLHTSLAKGFENQLQNIHTNGNEHMEGEHYNNLISGYGFYDQSPYPYFALNYP